jgi:class 3 adenylate cyclase
MKKKTRLAKAFAEELLLYSGQFGLFYIIMQFIIEGGRFFSNTGHVGLSLALLIQAFLLSLFGNKKAYRVIFSFVVPIVYSLLEYSEGSAYLLNAAHVGFWIYAVLSAALMLIRMDKSEILQRITEIVLVLINVFIFLYLYFYFDTWKDVQDSNKLTITNVYSYLGTFLSDPTHWFIIAGGCLLAITIALGRYEVARLKDKIASLFGKYVDSNIRDTIIAKGKYDAQKADLCVLFSDIVSFTNLCEKHDASSIARMLNIYFEYWNTIVKRHNGTIDKYIGDAIMVIFGLGNDKNPCDMAAMCALDAHENKEELYGILSKNKLPVPSGFGIGCHFGELIIGDIGSADRKNFTVIGDTVNIASRLESVTRKVNNKIIISSEVYYKLNENIKGKFASIGKVELKGKSAGVLIWGNKSAEG